jgi:hypothetical protein
LSDPEEYDTQFLALQEALNAADFLAYSAIFSEYGNGGGGKDYIALSRVQIKKAIPVMADLIKVVTR